MDVRLNFSRNSVRNTILSNDSLGVYYTVSKAGGITSVTRRDIRQNAEVVVGQFELPAFRKDRIRLGQNGEWQLLKDFLGKADRRCCSPARSFKASNGISYRWKPRRGDLVMTEDSRHQTALVTYKRHFTKNSSYLEISDSSLLGWFDNIILTFLIMEKKRRDAQKAAAASGGGGGGG